MRRRNALTSAKSGVQRLIAVSGSATLRQLPSAGAVEAEPGQLAASRVLATTRPAGLASRNITARQRPQRPRADEATRPSTAGAIRCAGPWHRSAPPNQPNHEPNRHPTGRELCRRSPDGHVQGRSAEADIPAGCDRAAQANITTRMRPSTGPAKLAVGHRAGWIVGPGPITGSHHTTPSRSSKTVRRMCPVPRGPALASEPAPAWSAELLGWHGVRRFSSHDQARDGWLVRDRAGGRR